MGEKNTAAENPERTGMEVLKGLSERDRRFAELYAMNGNILRSSVLAGCNRDYGHQLLQRPEVLAAVEFYRETYLDKATYTPAKLIRQRALQASFNPSSLLRDDWSIKELGELDEETREHLAEALVGFEIIEKQGSRTIKPKFAKVEAQEALEKIARLYLDDKERVEGMTIEISIAAPGPTVDAFTHKDDAIDISIESPIED